MTKPSLPRFNPSITPSLDMEALDNYNKLREATRRKRRRNQRLGDMALGAFCFGIGWMLVHVAAGAWR